MPKLLKLCGASQNHLGCKEPLRTSSNVNSALPCSPLKHVPTHLLNTSRGWRLQLKPCVTSPPPSKWRNKSKISWVEIRTIQWKQQWDKKMSSKSNNIKSKGIKKKKLPPINSTGLLPPPHLSEWKEPFLKRIPFAHSQQRCEVVWNNPQAMVMPLPATAKHQPSPGQNQDTHSRWFLFLQECL